MYGLSAEEVLAMSDKDLNQIVGLKQLAPYRDDVKKLRPNYKALQSIKAEAAAATQQQAKKRKKHGANGQGQGGRPWQGGSKQQQRPGERKPWSGGKQQQQQQREGAQEQGQQQQQQLKLKKPKQKAGQQQAELDPEARSKARLESYGKLSLKRDKQEAQAKQQGGQQEKQQQKAKKRKKPEAPAGRLAKVQVEGTLTKAQRKNLKRLLKRREERGEL
jgi:protein KRI1